MPPHTLANRLDIGPVPQCLRDLSIVEEALIARRRAKVWVIHMRGDDDPSDLNSRPHGPTVGHAAPIIQRGFKGHVVVYPAHPENLGSKLPLPIKDIVTPICVVFVGSAHPMNQWLREKAKPLIVRREKVREALVWLKQNNALYADIEIDSGTLSQLPVNDIAPVDITVVPDTLGLSSIGDRYDNSASSPGGAEEPPVFQSMVVTDIEGKNVSSKEMTAAAMRHLQKGGGFLEVNHDLVPCNEYTDYDLFPLMYPSLFPYGWGGFDDPGRKRKVSMSALAKHFFSLADDRFQTHYSFLFSVFNILQRREVSLGATLMVNKDSFSSFTRDLRSVSSQAIARVVDMLAKGQALLPKDDEERKVVRLMKQVNMVSRHARASSASHTAMRNEIRGMMMELGLPSFYVTINPADVYNPVVRFLAGEEIDVDNILPNQPHSFWNQASLIAKNPFVAAKFFDLYITSFFESLIGLKKGGNNSDQKPGVLGVAKAYYGCVEVQGRGTLHCHMLIWLEGALNPQEIRDRVVNSQDSEFADRMCAFIDHIIGNSVPPEPPDSSQSPNCNRNTDSHPCSTRGPQRAQYASDGAYSHARDLDFHRLVCNCQVHKHTDTCYKYWKGGDDPKECRFGLSETNHVPKTTFDMNTGEMQFRVSEGLVNNFCESILRAIRSNMDIQFINSGASGKAILYYITDYITKTQLKLHTAYAALQGAIAKLENEMSEDDDEFTCSAKTMLVKCANALLSRQELSAQQVAASLMHFGEHGHGDHYTSHKFSTLYWQGFENTINTCESLVGSEEQEDSPVANSTTAAKELMLDTTAAGQIHMKGNRVMDYVYCPQDFLDVCVWDFIALAEKKKKKPSSSSSGRDETDECGSDDRAEEINDGDIIDSNEVDNDDFNCNEEEDRAMTSGRVKKCKCTGRKRNPAGDFLPEHPECRVSFLMLKGDRYRRVPVPVGPSLPRRDKPEQVERYCRMMLILFKPWRTVSDLKETDEGWVLAFEKFLATCPLRLRKIMDNMQVLHECKDSRDDHFQQRREKRVQGLRSLAAEYTAQRDGGDGEEEEEEDNQESMLDHLTRIAAMRSNRHNAQVADADRVLRALSNAGFFTSLSSSLSSSSPSSLQDASSGGGEEDVQSDYTKQGESVTTVLSVNSKVAQREWKKAYEERRRNWKHSARVHPSTCLPSDGQGTVMQPTVSQLTPFQNRNPQLQSEPTVHVGTNMAKWYATFERRSRHEGRDTSHFQRVHAESRAAPSFQ